MHVVPGLAVLSVAYTLVPSFLSRESIWSLCAATLIEVDVAMATNKSVYAT